MRSTVHCIPEGVRYMDKSLDLVFLASSAFITLAKMLSLGPEKSFTEVNAFFQWKIKLICNKTNLKSFKF